MVATTTATSGSPIVQSKHVVMGVVNLAAAFALVCVLWYLFMHPNGVMALYTPMYGFSLLVVFVASIVLISKVVDFYPLAAARMSPPVRGIVFSVAAYVMMLVLVYGVFWSFIGKFGITYFSPHAIVDAGGVGAEIFNARENASTAIIYLFTAFLWVALLWSAGFGHWPWQGAAPAAAALGRLGIVGLLTVVVYVVLFHPHVSYLFYPAQTMAGVEPWWASWAMTSSAYYNLGILLCMVLWIVITDVLWDGYPWRFLDADGEGNFLRGLAAMVGTAVLGIVTFVVMLRVMELFWFEPFEGGQYTDAPYFRYLHAGEIAGFAILGAFAIRTYLGNILRDTGLWLRAAVRTVAAAAVGAALYLFYYSEFSTLLLGKVPGIGQPEDTPLVWTLLFLAVVLVQLEFFSGWPLERDDQQ